MIYDFYANFQISKELSEKSKKEIEDLTKGASKYSEVRDALSRIMLLTTVYAIEGKLPDRKGKPGKVNPDVFAKVGEGEYISGLKALIHSNGNYNDYLQCVLSKLHLLNIDLPVDSSSLPRGSWVIEFPVVLKKPFISRDDVPFYIIDNPVRKDKVFGIPFTSAMAWKGNLRWAMMKVFLEPVSDKPEEFARTRFRHTLLFGTEKGWGEVKGWTEFLDKLCLGAKEEYMKLIKEKFKEKEAKDIHLQGMLHFYPTFWNKIDMMVINPHDRETKTGKNPIYFEVVPAGAKGSFRLVYVPFYWTGLPDDEFEREIIEDLESVIKGLKETMLTYGFSAKKSSGFGVIEDKWDNSISRLEIKGYGGIQRFGNFEELKRLVDNWRV